MNNLLIVKSAALGLFLSAFTIKASAQKIEEQELKVNINKISSPIQLLKQLEPITFNYNSSKYKHLKLPAGEQIGFLSSTIKQAHPELIYEVAKTYETGKNNSRTARYDDIQAESLIPVLVAAITAQQVEIDLLKKELLLLKEKSK